MKSLSLGITYLTIFCISGAIFAQAPTQAEIAARDYSLHGISIGTTKAEFLRKFPHARDQDSARPNVTAMYATLKGHHQYLLVEFYDEKVYYMGLTFSPSMLAKIGGRNVLETKITKTLGYPNSVNGTMSYWKFPKVSRKVGYKQSVDGSSTLLVIDTAIDKQRRESQVDDLDIGF